MAWFLSAELLGERDGKHSSFSFATFQRVDIALKCVLSMNLDGSAFGFCYNSNLSSFYFSGLCFDLLP